MAVFIKLALGSAELFGRMPQMIHLKLCIQKRGWRTWKIIIDMHNQVLKWLNRLNALDFQAQIKSLNATDLSAKTMNGGRRFSTNYSPCNILQSQRIPSVSKRIREILIDEYCPSSETEIKASGANSCLIRPYLGS